MQKKTLISMDENVFLKAKVFALENDVTFSKLITNLLNNFLGIEGDGITDIKNNKIKTKVVNIVHDYPLQRQNKGSYITHRELSQRTSYFLSKDDRNRIIEELLEDRIIIKKIVPINGNQESTLYIFNEVHDEAVN